MEDKIVSMEEATHLWDKACQEVHEYEKDKAALVEQITALQAQIAGMSADLRDAMEIIESVADDIAKDYYHNDKVLCAFCGREEHSKNCVVSIAKEFMGRPTIKELLKDKP